MDKQPDPQGPMQGVPAWVFDRSMPEHWMDRIVLLCVERSTKGVFGLPLENQGLPEEELIAVGLALRDPDLLTHAGHDIRGAWQAVPWPAGIQSIRQQVLWHLSELERAERNRGAGVTDLFDVYDPSRAEIRARAADASAKRSRQAGDEEAARQSVAFAYLQRSIADERRSHDDEAMASAAAFWTNSQTTV